MTFLKGRTKMLKRRLKGLLALALAAVISVTMLIIPASAASAHYIFVTTQTPGIRFGWMTAVDYSDELIGRQDLPTTVYSAALSNGAVTPIQEITGWKAWGGYIYTGDGSRNNWIKETDDIAVGASGGDAVTIEMAESAEAATGGNPIWLSLEIEWRYKTLEMPFWDIDDNRSIVTITADNDGNVNCSGYTDGTECLLLHDGKTDGSSYSSKEELWEALKAAAETDGESFDGLGFELRSIALNEIDFYLQAPLAGSSDDTFEYSAYDKITAKVAKWLDEDGNAVDTFEKCKKYTAVISFAGSAIAGTSENYRFSPDLAVTLNGKTIPAGELTKKGSEYSFSYTFEGQHETLIKHAAKAATCTEEGNIAYYECKDCGALFAVSESDTLVEIALEDTVIPMTDHIFLDKYESDANGHWHVCAVCSKASEKEAHRGGTATTVKKAVCEVCGQEYGDYAKPAETTTTTTTTAPITGPTGTRPNIPAVTTTTTTTAATTITTESADDTDDIGDISDDRDDNNNTLTPPDTVQEDRIFDINTLDDVDWVVSEITNADDGTCVILRIHIHVPPEAQKKISDALKGRSIAMVADLNEGYRWIVNGRDIRSGAPLFPEVAIGAKNVASNDGWVSLFNEYDLFDKFNEYDLFNKNADMLGKGGFRFWTPNRKNDNSMRSFESLLHIFPVSINHDGKLEHSRLEFNIRDYIDLGRDWYTDDINAHFISRDDDSINRKNDSLYYANLYRITDVNELDNNGFKFDIPTLDFCGSYPFDDDGLIGLYFDHASDYIVVVDKYDHSKDADKAIKTVSSVDGASDDSNPHTGVTLGFASMLIAGAAAAVLRKKKK